MRRPTLSRVTEVKRVQSWRIHLIALGGVALILLFSLLGIQKATDKIRTQQPHANKSVGELIAPAIIGQTFTAEYQGLSLVQVRFATLARANTGPVIFHLRASPEATNDLFTTTIEATDLEDNAYYTFEFPPIRDSAGRSFYFCLEAPEAEHGNAITVWGATEDFYPAGEAVLRGLEERSVRDLAFRLGYDPPLGTRGGILLDNLVANKPSLWGDKWLYILLAAAYLALLYALFARVVGLAAFEENK